MGFFRDSTEVIMRALNFTRSKIQEFYKRQMESIDTTHRDILEGQMKKDVEEIDRLVEFLNEHADRPMILTKEEYDYVNSLIRSTCNIYAQDLREMKRKTGLSGDLKS